MPRKSAAALSVVAGTIDGRPAPPEDLTEFQREVWQLTVTSEASKFFNTAALQVARQRAISLSATSDMLRARPGGTHGPPGASESFGRPYRDRVGSRNLSLTQVFVMSAKNSAQCGAEIE